MVFLNMALFSCTPTAISDVQPSVVGEETDCCGNGGDIPPPPPNP